MVACVNFAVCRKADFANRLVCASCLTTDTIGCFGVRVVCHAKLTAPLLRELIEKITVYETEGAGKNRSQRVMIHYKFVGYIEIPECGKNYRADTRKGVAVEYVTKSA
ncbi:MAG: DUF4368 domain-containing protein [Oscillospiraceae bacterium]|nr:DUF4368 domain-containing protein [Oscillospiraceae bacterium]